MGLGENAPESLVGERLNLVGDWWTRLVGDSFVGDSLMGEDTSLVFFVAINCPTSDVGAGPSGLPSSVKGAG